MQQLRKISRSEQKSLPTGDQTEKRIVYNVVTKQKMPSDHILFLEDTTMKKNEQYNKVCGGIEKPNSDTELVFIIDRSGSMSGFEADTIGGFNSMIEKQKGEGEGTVYVSTVLFDNCSEVIHDRVPITEVAPMTRADYTVRGCTALLDAIGEAVHHIGNVHKYARREDVPAHTVFVITTDGMENASRTYSSEKVKKMIKKKTEENGWEFIFLAANIDAVQTAGDIGIGRDRAANYRQTRDGYTECYDAMSTFVTMARCAAPNKKIGSAWKKKLEKNDDGE